MTTKVFMVTGVTSGIGKALATQLAQTGEIVILVARDVDRGNAVVQEITQKTQNWNLDLQLCDLSNLSSVNNLASVVKLKYNTINLLINNAAVYKRQRQMTVDGYETMFASNHLGPFLLTNLLLDALIGSGSGRILNITAPSTTPLDFDDLQGERNFNSLHAFGATKMANLLFTFELARRLEGSNVTANAIHPGLARSQLMKEAFAPLRLLTWLLSSPPHKAAEHILKLATAPEFENVSGRFFHNDKEVEAPAYARDRENQERLWEVSEKLTDTSRIPSLTGS
jgi:NAD(P)-dependent dehydrogenase (short-subunit alcohol dehydrogenase family)